MKHEIWCPLEDLKKEGLWYTIVTRDRYGKIVARERRKSRSFLKQWNQLVYVNISGESPYSVVDIGGIARDISYGIFEMIAAATIDSYGIRVGTGNTPVAIDDYALETPCDEGVGANQMEHLICTVDDFAVAAPSCSFVAHRTIANNSGNPITVREAAIYLKMHGLYYCCGVRDVLTAPQAVPNGGAITIDWSIGVTV